MQAVVPEEGDFARANPELGRRVALQLVSTDNKNGKIDFEEDDAPHRRQRGDQGRHSVHRRFQRPVPLPGRQDRQECIGRTTCSRPRGARR